MAFTRSSPQRRQKGGSEGGRPLFWAKGRNSRRLHMASLGVSARRGVGVGVPSGFRLRPGRAVLEHFRLLEHSVVSLPHRDPLRRAQRRRLAVQRGTRAEAKAIHGGLPCPAASMDLSGELGQGVGGTAPTLRLPTGGQVRDGREGGRRRKRLGLREPTATRRSAVVRYTPISAHSLRILSIDGFPTPECVCETDSSVGDCLHFTSRRTVRCCSSCTSLPHSQAEGR